jgi:hypothetical protein
MLIFTKDTILKCSINTKLFKRMFLDLNFLFKQQINHSPNNSVFFPTK